MRFQRLAGRLLYGDPRLRSAEAVVAQPQRSDGAVEVRHLRRPPDPAGHVDDGSQLPLFSELLKAHEYLRGKGLPSISSC